MQNKRSTSGFVYDEFFLKHNPGNGHPECSERLSRTIEYIRNKDWYSSLIQVSPQPIGLDRLELVHSYDYIKRVKENCLSGSPYLDSMDVGISKQSFDAALLAAGGSLQLADSIIEGYINNGFAMLRPPGHHAEHDMAIGFCLFNNVAIIARYLQNKHKLDKILILDWDVHHGNGTQHTFEEDPSILYISTHQYPFYPGTGSYEETGAGAGRGATLNYPMPSGSNDQHYEQAFREKILPKINEFKPEFIIISAGFDAHEQDPLAEINLSTKFFGWMTDRLLEAADQNCDGKIISVLEGGYNLNILPHCIEEHLLKLSNYSAVK